MTVRDFGAYARGVNCRFENLGEQWEITNTHSDILKKHSDILKRVADNEAGLHPTVRALIKENQELKARLVKMESDVKALQKAVYPLRACLRCACLLCSLRTFERKALAFFCKKNHENELGHGTPTSTL